MLEKNENEAENETGNMKRRRKSLPAINKRIRTKIKQYEEEGKVIKRRLTNNYEKKEDMENVPNNLWKEEESGNRSKENGRTNSMTRRKVDLISNTKRVNLYALIN
jgi:hypothetical protein